MPDSPEYTLRSIYAFTKIDDTDILFFGLHAQEYSPEISGPNRGSVSITYLDSVAYFEPRHLKTKIYQQILLSYMDYVRRKGMTRVFLWVCPPEIGNDFIFHRHPVDQKLPKKDRLKNWYETTFQKGMNDMVVSKYENLSDYYGDKTIITPTDLAYFDGDFWPGEIETLLTEVDKDVKSRLNSSGKICRKRKRKQKDTSIIFDLENIDNEIEQRLKKLLHKWGEDFIVVTLQGMQIKEEPVAAKPIPHWVCEILETRDKFLPFCKDFNLEFSSLRRVKYATMRIVNEVFRENKKFQFFCNQCQKKNIHVRFYCKRCLDYDLCQECFSGNTHEHELYKEEAASQQLSPDELSELVVHCFSCTKPNCGIDFCSRMKEIQLHFESCSVPSCKSCKEAIAAFLTHTKKCEILNCAVYTCCIQLKEMVATMKIIHSEIKQIKETYEDRKTRDTLFGGLMRGDQRLQSAYKKYQVLPQVKKFEINNRISSSPGDQKLQIVNKYKDIPIIHQGIAQHANPTAKPEEPKNFPKPELPFVQRQIKIETQKNHFEFIPREQVENVPKSEPILHHTPFKMDFQKNLLQIIPRERPANIPHLQSIPLYNISNSCHQNVKKEITVFINPQKDRPPVTQNKSIPFIKICPKPNGQYIIDPKEASKPIIIHNLARQPDSIKTFQFTNANGKKIIFSKPRTDSGV